MRTQPFANREPSHPSLGLPDGKYGWTGNLFTEAFCQIRQGGSTCQRSSPTGTNEGVNAWTKKEERAWPTTKS
jgi:hypothetical protein